DQLVAGLLVAELVHRGVGSVHGRILLSSWAVMASCVSRGGAFQGVVRRPTRGAGAAGYGPARPHVSRLITAARTAPSATRTRSCAPGGASSTVRSTSAVPSGWMCWTTA